MKASLKKTHTYSPTGAGSTTTIRGETLVSVTTWVSVDWAPGRPHPRSQVFDDPSRGSCYYEKTPKFYPLPIGGDSVFLFFPHRQSVGPRFHSGYHATPSSLGARVWPGRPW